MNMKAMGNREEKGKLLEPQVGQVAQEYEVQVKLSHCGFRTEPERAETRMYEWFPKFGSGAQIYVRDPFSSTNRGVGIATP